MLSIDGALGTPVALNERAMALGYVRLDEATTPEALNLSNHCHLGLHVVLHDRLRGPCARASLLAATSLFWFCLYDLAGCRAVTGIIVRITLTLTSSLSEGAALTRNSTSTLLIGSLAKSTHHQRSVVLTRIVPGLVFIWLDWRCDVVAVILEDEFL